MSGDDRRRFATTRWSLILAVRNRGSANASSALASLCEMYWFPVYAFIRRTGVSRDEADDLTQAFFTRVVEKGFFGDARQERGRFRTFLLAAVRHFLSNERDRERTLKRGGQHVVVSLDVETAEGHYQLDPRDDLTPERLFDRRWALTLIARVLTRLDETYTTGGKRVLFDRLKGFLTGDNAGTPYAEIARTLGMSEGAVKVAAHRLRRQFREMLIDEISQTVSEPGEIDAEIQYLLNAVRA